MIKVLKSLRQCHLLSLQGLWYSCCAVRKVGINLMALLYISQRFNPQKIALQDDNSQVSFKQLYQQSQHLADHIATLFMLKPKQKVAVVAYNHIPLAHTLFALSALGVDIYLINAEISAPQFAQLDNNYHFDLVILDPHIHFILQPNMLFTYHDYLPSVQSLLNVELTTNKVKRKVSHFSKIIVLTSGSTGNFKLASRKTNAKNFIAPFTTLLTKLKLNQYSSIYIATPIYHGFGMATLCISILLGATSFLRKKFETQQASQLIHDQQIEVITLVPLMLSRLLQYDANALSRLQCIITGGAPIAEHLVNRCLSQLGKILFNLYGTSEAGICTIATPDDLAKRPNTIGLPIPGLETKLIAEQKIVTAGIGELYIKCAWSTQGNQWIATGDLAYCDQQGYYYLQGRVDDMIVSAGENVYPYTLEQQLLMYPWITEAYVMPVNDREFGQRLVAFVVLDPQQQVSVDTLMAWLKTKIARYQQPQKIILLNEIPLTAIGKPDKKRLLMML